MDLWYNVKMRKESGTLRRRLCYGRNKEYFSKEVENGSIQISEEVVASVAAMAVLEVEGVCGLASNLGYDIAEMLGKKTLAKGVRMSTEGDALRIDCEIVAQFGQPVFVLARNVQEHVKSCVESLTGLSVAQVNVNVSGIALPREGKSKRERQEQL